MIKLVGMKVDLKDRDRLRSECKKLFIMENPSMEGMKLSDRFMFHRLINFYTKK